MNIKRYLTTRKRAFRRIAESEDGKIFLADIYKFCESKDPVVPNDSLSTGRNIGKELVAKHIKKVLHQDDSHVEELLMQYKKTMSKQ